MQIRQQGTLSSMGVITSDSSQFKYMLRTRAIFSRTDPCAGDRLITRDAGEQFMLLTVALN